ncbi:hypothetical protein F2P81_003716 [Scophthalmus maximus]|uniref:Uncharacterized protein n=1 Tax=Scophthalmus maximus TaxID=52904 RepID=A0A6A4TJD7_SCOMX|nr:hypothetical protein F2P81_003716 [Scophthalmus maximus]
MENRKRWKLVVSNCVDKSKPPRSNSRYNYLKGEALVEVFFKVSPYAADHNLLPHLQNIYRDGTQVFPPSEEKKHTHIPGLLSKTEKQLQRQIERVWHTSQDQRIESFLGSER